jgi:hypothetical protein
MELLVREKTGDLCAVVYQVCGYALRRDVMLGFPRV